MCNNQIHATAEQDKKAKVRWCRKMHGRQGFSRTRELYKLHSAESIFGQEKDFLNGGDYRPIIHFRFPRVILLRLWSWTMTSFIKKLVLEKPVLTFFCFGSKALWELPSKKEAWQRCRQQWGNKDNFLFALASSLMLVAVLVKASIKQQKSESTSLPIGYIWMSFSAIYRSLVLFAALSLQSYFWAPCSGPYLVINQYWLKIFVLTSPQKI